MGIFDFFKKLTKNKKREEPEKKKIIFSELRVFIERQIKEIKTKEEEIFYLIKEKIDVLLKNIAVKINVAKNFNINLQKADDRIKGIVEEGRKKYFESVENLMNLLNNLKKDGFENIIASINKIFLDFNKRSHISYERATILIGKEMSEVKEILKEFSKDLIKLFNENQELIDSSKKFSFIELKLKELEKTKKEFDEINLEIIFLDNEIINKEKEKKKVLNEIEEIKKSPEYLEMQKKEEKIKIIKEELEKEIFNLKQIIDFKALGNFYHVFEGEMNIVNAHNKNFQINFQKDAGKNILRLLDEAKLNNKDIFDKVNKINHKREEILNFEAGFKNEKSKNQINELFSKVTPLIFEIEDLNNKKLKEEKRLKNLSINKEEIIKRIKKDIESLDFEILD
ncbi:MAG: hypothetical protein AABX44_01600 [Nanoarchaeota archaeon]